MRRSIGMSNPMYITIRIRPAIGIITIRAIGISGGDYDYHPISACEYDFSVYNML